MHLGAENVSDTLIAIGCYGKNDSGVVVKEIKYSAIFLLLQFLVFLDC